MTPNRVREAGADEMSRSWEDRVDEYVNSPRLRHRLKLGKLVSCTVLGNGGVYQTRAALRGNTDSECSCPYEGFPCKHVVALQQTYKAHPKTFHDVDAVLNKLRQKPADELLQDMRRMILASPSCMAGLGVPGFEPLDETEREEW